MNDKHLTSEQLVDLYHDSTSAESRECRDHLDRCESCRNEFTEISAALDLTSRFDPPEIHPSRRVEIFETAWNRSQRNPEGRGWTIGAVLRHACTFGIGMALGMVLIVSQTAVSINAPNGNTANQPSIQAKNPIPQHVQSQTFDRLYTNLESPVLVVEEAPDKPKESKRVLYGTIDNEKVQVVWNF